MGGLQEVAFMELHSRLAGERRSGHDRRKYSDLNYLGPERRSGFDRRFVTGGMQSVRLQPVPFAMRAEPGPALAQRLSPPNGQRFLSPLVVVKRIECEFAFVEADEEEGCRHVQEMMKRLVARNNGRRNGVPDERLEHLANVMHRAVHVCFGDDPGTETEWLCTVVIPAEPLVFEYESLVHARSVQGLLRRCAKILGYGILQAAADDMPRTPRLCVEH